MALFVFSVRQRVHYKMIPANLGQGC